MLVQCPRKNNRATAGWQARPGEHWRHARYQPAKFAAQTRPVLCPRYGAIYWRNDLSAGTLRVKQLYPCIQALDREITGGIPGQSLMAGLREKQRARTTTRISASLTCRLLSFDFLVDLFTVYGHMPGCFNANPDLITTNAQYGHRHVITHYQCFIYPSSQNQHCRCSVKNPESCWT